MSYGPQLPPHLQKPREVGSDDPDSDNEDQIGPKLPGSKKDIDLSFKIFHNFYGIITVTFFFTFQTFPVGVQSRFPTRAKMKTTTTSDPNYRTRYKFVG
jgi:hypothetical protein